jgi:WXG100 family type VII secretion target
MTAKVIRADYDALSQMASSFGLQAEQVRKTLQQLNREVDDLQAGDWLGQGAQAFYAEMNGQVLPTINRLVRALETAGDVTRQVNQIAQQAEQEAAAFLRLDGNGNGAGAALGAAAAGPDAAGTSSGAEMDAVDGIPDASSALWKPGKKSASGGTGSKKPGATSSVRAKQGAEEALAQLRTHNPKLVKAIENDPALRALLERVSRAGYLVWAGKAEFDAAESNIFIGRDTTVESFKTMARLAIENPRILKNLDPKVAAVIMKDMVLRERVLDWSENADANGAPIHLEMGSSGSYTVAQERDKTGTTVFINPDDPKGSIDRAHHKIEAERKRRAK